jgi:hypothetical protein
MREHCRQLHASVEASRPRGFVVRLTRAFVLCAISGHRIPRPTFLTMRNAPHGGRGTAESVPLICPTSQVKLPATQWHDEQISWLSQIDVK